MVVTVPGDSGVRVRSRVVEELAPDPARAPILLHSMAVMTAQAWEQVLRLKVAIPIAAVKVNDDDDDDDDDDDEEEDKAEDDDKFKT